MTDPTADLDATLASLQSQLDTHDLALSNLDEGLVSLDARVTVLEGAGPPPGPEPEDLFLPVSYPDLAAALADGLGGGRTVEQFVTWPSPEPAGTREGCPWTIEDQFRAMAEGQILWLPERDEPYWIDSFDGFAAAGVSHVTDTSLPAGEQRVEISDKWHGKSARTWFAMTRPPKYGGVLGAGAGAVIDVLDAGFTRPPQGTEDTMTYTDNGGSTFKITGCQEKLFDTSSGKTYWGNFTLRCSPDLGGVAFIGIGAGDATVEQVHFDGCWHGHSFAPNGESGALAVATHTVRRNTFDCHGIGKTSVMMANRAGPSVMEDIRIVNYDDQVGSITYWESKPGVSEWHNVRSPKSVNMEANGSGGVFTLKVFGGTLGGGNYHLNVRSPYSSQVFELHDVERVGGPEVWQANCWGSAPYMQQASTFKAWDEDGNALPTKTAGATAGGTVASLSEAPSFEELVLYLLGQLRTTDPAGLTDRIRSLLSR